MKILSSLWTRRALIGLGVLSLGFGLWATFLLPKRGPLDSGHSLRAELIAEVGPVRPVEARLAGFEYAPKGTQAQVTSSLRKIARRIKDDAERQSMPDALGALALVKLLGDDENQVLRLRVAIALLEQATSQPQAGAHLWSDLAAVYLESADQDAPWNYPRALQAALRAVQIQGDLPEARFNLALALEKNLLAGDAWKSWAQFRDLEVEPNWVAEAYGRQGQLEQPSRFMVWKMRQPGLAQAALSGDRRTVERTVKEFPFRARIYAEEELLPEWAQAFIRGQVSEAERSLKILRPTGEALASFWGEHMAKDSVSVIDRFSRSFNEAPSLAVLANAYQAYREGRDLCGENQGIRGSVLLEEARSGFQEAGSPALGWASYYLAVCAYQQSNYRNAVERAELLLLEPEIDRYPSLVGRTHWILGLSLLALGEPGPVLKSYSLALDIFERTDAGPEVGGICNLLGEAYVYLGERREAWRFFHRARATAMKEGDLRRRFATADQEADLAVKEGLVQAALRFRNEVVRLALSQRDPPGQTHAFLRRAGTWFLLGQLVKTRQDLESARLAWARIDDEDERRRREADLLLAEGRLLVADHPAAALAPLERALEIYHADGNRYALVGAHLDRAKALLKVGRAAEAESDLKAGIREFERQRGQVRNEELRITYFDQARELFDLLIGIQADRPGREVEAFDTAERQRARVLLDRLVSGRRAEPLPLREIQRRLPPDVALVAYSLLPDRLLIWVIRGDGYPLLIQSSVPESSLTAFLHHLWSDLMSASEGRAATQLAILSGVILDPVRPSLRKGDRILFVPDKSLYRVPFAALRHREGGYLVEKHASMIMPSASLAVRTMQVSVGPMDMLVVADPQFDHGSFPDLTLLEGARAEADALKALFGDRASVLSGAAATREAFKREIGKRSMLHVSAHAVLNPDHPHLSHLLLAPLGADDDGLLSAEEVQNLSMPRMQVVSLAGCRTGAGKLSSEGVSSLGRAFLAAGAPVVVTSLWDLDDTFSAKFYPVFFQQLRQGKRASEALRQMQIDAIRVGIEAFDWASLQVLAGV